MFDFLSKKITGALSWLQGQSRLSKENISLAVSQVRDALLEADVPFEVVESFLRQVSDDIAHEKIETHLKPGQQFIKIVHKQLVLFLGGKTQEHIQFMIPSTILLMGLQGSGKTTTVAKLAAWVQKEAKKRGKTRRVLVASVDFYRPAAIDQVRILAQSIGVDFYASSKTDPVSAAKECSEYAKKHGYEHFFLDTAGRLHVDDEMLKELAQIDRAVNPKYKILVLDAMTGQESLRVARRFLESVGFDGVILSKLDSDTRGGAAFSFRFSLQKPIFFVGTGEKVGDLESFSPERVAGRILGMGDILSLIEQTEEKIDKETQNDLGRRFMQGNFTLEDFGKQLDMVASLGPIQKIMQYLPGGASLSSEAMEQGKEEMNRFKAIINSMTPKERKIPQVLDGSRKKRIARGSGTTPEEVNKLIIRFEQSKQFAKLMKKMGKTNNFFG